MRAVERSRDDTDWEAARALSGRIAKETENPSFQQTLAEVDAAAARPRFADACPLTYTADCNVTNLLGYQRVAAVAILGSALRDDFEAALKRLEAQLKTQLDLAGSSRGLLTTLMAGAQIDNSVGLVRLVLAGLSHEKAPVPAEGLKSIAALLEAAPDEDNARRAVICQYLYTVSAIRLLAPSWRPEGTAPSVSGTSGEWLQRFTLDPDHTLELANTYYASVMAAVDGTSPGAMPEMDPGGSLLWWLYNPAGKMLLSTDATLPLHLPRLAAQRAKSLALRMEVRKELLDLAASEPDAGAAPL